MPDLSFFDPFYLLVGACVLLLAWSVYLEWRLRRFTLGKNGNSLEDSFHSLADSVKQTDKVNQEIKEHLIKMEERLQKSVQQVKTVRFNPFAVQGGNYSFATSFLDEHGDGVVISTLYSREKTSVFAKPIKNRASEFELSDEERRAIAL
ncbi:DUF4446 family protein [Candidatus Nomurabacteria bacterium]|nr:DUF4446 family protein [Candidatus Nomurabacteria bacterium]